MRIHDARLGRFFSKDPLMKQYPWSSPYAYADNNPIEFIDVDGEGPKEPLDPTLKGRLSSIVPGYVDVLKRCNNASLRSFESYAWTNEPKGTPPTARDNKYLGLAGEAWVTSYLVSRTGLFVRKLKNELDKQGEPKLSVEQIKSSSIKIGGYDDDKSIDIAYSLKLGNRGTYEFGINMPFNDINGRPINEKGNGEKFVKDVTFVMEVKTGTTIQNFLKGFTQATTKAKKVPNGIAVVVMDQKAYTDAIKESSGFKMYAQQFISGGGRLMLIGGLNDAAKSTLDDAKEEVRKGNNPNTIPSAKGREPQDPQLKISY